MNLPDEIIFVVAGADTPEDKPNHGCVAVTIESTHRTTKDVTHSLAIISVFNAAAVTALRNVHEIARQVHPESASVQMLGNQLASIDQATDSARAAIAPSMPLSPMLGVAKGGLPS